MPTPTSLAGFPDWFFTIAERAQVDGYKEELECSTRGAAINLRQRFYAFRKLLGEAGHPHAKKMQDLSLMVKGKTIIFDTNAGLAPSAIEQLQRSVVAPASPANAPDRVAVSDAAEEALNEFLYGSQHVSAPPVETPSPVDCKHEMDSSGSRCLLCGIPWSHPNAT